MLAGYVLHESLNLNASFISYISSYIYTYTHPYRLSAYQSRRRKKKKIKIRIIEIEIKRDLHVLFIPCVSIVIFEVSKTLNHPTAMYIYRYHHSIKIKRILDRLTTDGNHGMNELPYLMIY